MLASLVVPVSDRYGMPPLILQLVSAKADEHESSEAASVSGAPDWVGKFVLGVLVVGLPVALILAWAYELTPEGIKREKDVVRGASITHETGARLNKITIGVFLVAVAWVVSDRLLLQRDAPQRGHLRGSLRSTTSK